MRGTNTHLLLIGDDQEALTHIRGLLDQLAGPATSHLDYAKSFAGACDCLESQHYDLVFLDDRVEGRPAIELLRKLRQTRKLLPVTFLAGDASEEVNPESLHSAAPSPGKPQPNVFTLSRVIRCALCMRKHQSQCRTTENTVRNLSRAVGQSADLVIITARDGTIEYVNPAFEALTGYSIGEVIGRKPSLLKSGVQSPEFYRDLWETILAGQVFRGVLVNKKKNGETFHAEKTITPVRDPAGRITHFISNDRDITERKRLEAQLLQATKMDAIGQLAGGVAHDFNNLLMVISSYAELALDSLTVGHALRHNLDEILAASRRATDLTRQLLAFSRKQLQSLQVLDLNNILQELGRMLPRLIGEDIQMTLAFGKDLGKIKADPVQIEQIIMNLAANARDAMPHGGRLTFETSNVQLDEEYVHRRPIVPPGEYVLLTVADSGQGIQPQHLPHIFEPFFTTKEKGKGTGLGLATVYGIVKQSRGFIWVYSEAGTGTVFKIYLPRVGGAPKPTTTVGRTLKEAARGSETLLLVEDEEAVRRATREFLTMCGYNILEACDGADALGMANAYEGTIHLLLTDVVMPHLSGGQLAVQLAKTRPAMKVLYVSGYATATLLQHGVHAGEGTFLQKPFTLRMLAWKIRQVLTATASLAAPSASTQVPAEPDHS